MILVYWDLESEGCMCECVCMCVENNILYLQCGLKKKRKRKKGEKGEK